MNTSHLELTLMLLLVRELVKRQGDTEHDEGPGGSVPVFDQHQHWLRTHQWTPRERVSTPSRTKLANIFPGRR